MQVAPASIAVVIRTLVRSNRGFGNSENHCSMKSIRKNQIKIEALRALPCLAGELPKWADWLSGAHFNNNKVSGRSLRLLSLVDFDLVLADFDLLSKKNIRTLAFLMILKVFNICLNVTGKLAEMYSYISNISPYMVEYIKKCNKIFLHYSVIHKTVIFRLHSTLNIFLQLHTSLG